MSKLDDIMDEALQSKIEAVWNSKNGKVSLDKTKQQVKALMLELTEVDPKVVDRGNDTYNPSGKVGANEYKNGFNLAVAIIRKKVEEL